MIAITATTDIRGLNAYKAALEKTLQEEVDRMALIAEGVAKEKSPVDTGALKASIFAVTSQSNTGALAAAAARSLNPKSDPITYNERPAKHNSYVFCGVRYGQHVEYGAQGRAGRFMFTKTAEELNPIFTRNVVSAIQRMRI